MDVIQGNYKLAAGQQTLSNRASRYERLQPGISVANSRLSAGTLGMFVIDKLSGKPAILSNCHVLGGSLGDSIVQPGPVDGGKAPRDTVAKLERMILDQDGDAAIAILTNSRPFDPTAIDLNIIPDSIALPQNGDIVVKSGRTTKVTRGKIVGMGVYPMEFPGARVVRINGFMIVPISSSNKVAEISYTGDSGSIWIKEGTRTAVGLNFSGEPESSPLADYALACFISRVFFRLKIQPLIS